MDWKRYAERLEFIIAAIDMPDYRRKLVDCLINEAKQQAATSQEELSQ